ncbi:hypothetical protein PWT90_06210 [Aphanocladium album]|nr:hypothetical protein PWT90_06210 [Aphanocladium album]
MSHNSHGTKVDLGNKAPELNEGAGLVADKSLAAESLRKDGEFAKNVGIKSGQQFESNKNTNKAAPKAAEFAHGGTAPSYVVDTKLRDQNGPHGKNVREEEFDVSGDRDGLRRALQSEPGSKDDPSRLAEQQFEGRNAIPGSAPPVRDTKGGNSFETLDPNLSA